MFEEDIIIKGKNVLSYSVDYMTGERTIVYKNDFDGINITKPIRILPKKYIINHNATILFWNDGTKTIVKKSKDDEYNKKIGFLWAYFQKNSGLSKTKANEYLDNLEDDSSAMCCTFDWDRSNLNSFDYITQLAIENMKKIDKSIKVKK